MEKRVFKLFLVLFIIPLCLYAQNASFELELPYSCGFEDSIENQNWVLKTGPNADMCSDQWMIGNLDYREGYNALYISCDSGKTLTFGHNPNCVIAYRPFVIPQPDSVSARSCRVNISFAWKGGSETRKKADLRYYLLPDYAVGDGVDLKSNAISARFPECLDPETKDTLYALKSWTYESFQQQIKYGEKYYLIFAWQNNNVDTSYTDLGICIDDIQIISGNCPKLDSINVESISDTLIISWDAPHGQFDLEYRMPGMTTWRKMSNLEFQLDSLKKVVLHDLPEGLYDVRVRGICGNGEQSAWVTMSDIVVFCPERHCINYVKLEDNPEVECLKGFATNPKRGANTTLKETGLGQNGFSANPIDYGSKDIRSRHTVNWKQNEKDPRTGNELSTIPPGGLASVRLGNWSGGAMAEGIRYKFRVDTSKASIILMKYAVVLENPGHGIEQDPSFMLVLKDERGLVINQDCGKFDFSPKNENIEWKYFGNYVWKDWTSIGLNVVDYHGEDIFVELVTQDCLMSAHGGYAYFTLDCADAVIKTTSCGESPKIEMEAPEGFRYTWYYIDGSNNEVFVSDSIALEVPSNDIVTYHCRVDYLDIDGCSFEFSTEMKPRFAHADFDWEWKPQNCQNRVILKNKSCVYTRINGLDTPTDEECETFYWDINNGEIETIEEDVVLPVPKGGGTYTVTLVTGISKDICQDDTTITIVVPPISEGRDTIYKTKCESQHENFGGMYIVTDGTYVAEDTTWCGCDSSTVLNIKFVPLPEDTYVTDTVCGSQPYVCGGQKFYESGEYTVWLKNAMGCDSVVILNLIKENYMGVTIPYTERHVCADDSALLVDFESVDSLRQPVRYSLLFDSVAKSVGFLDKTGVMLEHNREYIEVSIPYMCRPNRYTVLVVFEDTISFCQGISIPIEFDVYYSSNIMQSKFDNLITIYDSAFNGGYSFEEYQWYKNDEIIEGENLSYYYLKDGEFFNSNNCYHLVLKRKDDGVVMPTCKICPGVETRVDYASGDVLLPTSLLHKNQRVVIGELTEGNVSVYTSTGQLLSSYAAEDGNLYFIAPSYSGIYIVYIVIKDYSISYKIQVR